MRKIAAGIAAASAVALAMGVAPAASAAQGSTPLAVVLTSDGDQFDSNWVGWPRMIVRAGLAYVFYTGNAQVGLRTISIDRLTNWETEGGETLPLGQTH